jgi:hypothetical protein
MSTAAPVQTRTCPGIPGEPCPRRVVVRAGEVCRTCRERRAALSERARAVRR